MNKRCKIALFVFVLFLVSASALGILLYRKFRYQPEITVELAPGTKGKHDYDFVTKNNEALHQTDEYIRKGYMYQCATDAEDIAVAVYTFDTMCAYNPDLEVPVYLGEDVYRDGMSKYVTFAYNVLFDVIENNNIDVYRINGNNWNSKQFQYNCVLTTEDLRSYVFVLAQVSDDEDENVWRAYVAQ